MKLPEADAKLFLKLYNLLLDFTNKTKKIVTTKSALTNNERVEVRDALFDDDTIINSYVTQNPNKLSKDDLKIINDWQGYIAGDFILLRQLSKYAIFMKDSKAYGVLALNNYFEEMIYQFPAFVNTVLLPFKGQIIYDGLMAVQGINFGGGIKKSFNKDYSVAKAKYGIITTLDSNEDTLDADDEDIKMLQYYLKSQSNYHEYYDEICDLKYKNKKLEAAYYQAIGKLFAKTTKKYFKSIEFTKVFVAIHEHIVMGTAKTQKELEKQLKAIMPKDKFKNLYYFKVK